MRLRRDRIFFVTFFRFSSVASTESFFFPIILKHSMREARKGCCNINPLLVHFSQQFVISLVLFVFRVIYRLLVLIHRHVA